MKKFILSLAVLVAAGVSATHAQDLEFNVHTIRDKMVGNKDAVTFLKPAGWTVTGGVQWYPNLSHQACLELKISNPRGLEQIETFPWTNCCWFTNPVIPMQRGHNYMGEIVEMPIDDPLEVVRKFTIPLFRGQYKVRIVSYTDMPHVAKALSEFHANPRVKAGKIRIEYAIDGQMVEEDIYLSIYQRSMNIGNNNIATSWGPAWAPFSFRAAKGQLDAKTPLMLAVVNSAQGHGPWYADLCFVQQLFRDRMAQGIQNAIDISNVTRRNGEEVFRMYSDSYWKRQASQERVFNNYSLYTRGLTPYHNPFMKNSTFQLPNTHQYAWGSSSGGVILSNNPSFDPNRGSSHTWQLLQQAR